MAQIRLEPGKRFRRDESFTETVVDCYLEENDFTEDIHLVIETVDEPYLKIPLKYKTWIEYDGGRSPRYGSNAYRFFESLVNIGVDVDIDVDRMEVRLTPTLCGKAVSFDVEHKSFASKTDMETVTVGGRSVQQPKIIEFDVWTVARIGGDGRSAITESPLKPDVQNGIPVNEDEIKAGYIDCLKEFGYEPFTLPNIIGVTNSFAKLFVGSVKDQYAVMKNKMKYLDALVVDGVLEKSPDGKYRFVDGMIEAVGA